MGRGLKRIGVFVCHCGTNIAGTVDVPRVVEEIARYPGVVHTEDYMYMCSDPGQDLLRKQIRENTLTGVVIACCTPTMHERTFRRAASLEDMNPYHLEIANIREQCSWPHIKEKETATRKAITIVRATIEKLRLNMELTPSVTPLTKRALVIGGGIAGIQAALDIANGGHEVILVERDTAIGGHARQLAGTFPTLERTGCLIAPILDEIAHHPLIKIYTCSDVEEVSGYVGNFTAQIRNRACFVDRSRCTACGLCLDRCPVSVPSEFDRGLSQRKPIEIPAPGAVPFQPRIDATKCLHFNDGECSACQEICPAGAIDFADEDTFVDEEVGAIIAAPGYDLLPPDRTRAIPQDPDIIDGLQFERILSSTGPTGGEIRRPSDGRTPQEIVFISCVGSRDPENGVPYCSRVCCMYIAKQAMLYRQAVPDGQAYIFYTDMRSDARDFEEFVQGAMSDSGILYLRGDTPTMIRDGDNIRILGVDTLAAKDIEISADLVVLARAIIPHATTKELGRTLNIASDEQGFLTEAHIKLRPVETLTSGIFLAGTAQWPRDIPDTITSASGAASKVLSLFSQGELLREPVVASVDEETCTGCGQCVSVCTYHAIEVDARTKIAVVNEALCEGCGACSVTCPSKAMQLKNWTHRQYFAMIDATVRL